MLRAFLEGWGSCSQPKKRGGAGAKTPPLLRVLALAEDPDSAPGSHVGVRWLVSVGGLYSGAGSGCSIREETKVASLPSH